MRRVYLVARLLSVLCLVVLGLAGCKDKTPPPSQPTMEKGGAQGVTQASAAREAQEAPRQEEAKPEQAQAPAKGLVPAREPVQGDEAQARALNKEGLALRKAGDHAGAREKYQAAVKADASFVPARYNLSCEVALAGEADQALRGLEELLAMTSPEAWRFVAHAQADEDFVSLREAPRFLALQRAVRLEDNEPAIAQLCAKRRRLAGVVDEGRGLLHYKETEEGPDGETPATQQTQLLKGARAHEVLEGFLGPMSTWCNDCAEEPEADFTPLGTRAGHRCVRCDVEGEWGSAYELCFVRDAGAWKVAVASEYPTGPLAGEFLQAIQKNVARAREKGLARFRP